MFNSDLPINPWLSCFIRLHLISRILAFWLAPIKYFSKTKSFINFKFYSRNKGKTSCAPFHYGEVIFLFCETINIIFFSS